MEAVVWIRSQGRFQSTEAFSFPERQVIILGKNSRRGKPIRKGLAHT